jgi:hypothetical protein
MQIAMNDQKNGTIIFAGGTGILRDFLRHADDRHRGLKWGPWSVSMVIRSPPICYQDVAESAHWI